jgi:hypothetical protein
LTAPSAASVSVSPTTGTAGTTTYTATPSASGSPTITYSYQWKYWDQGSTYLSISGATSSTYSPPSNFTSLYGNSLRCDIVASNGIGTNATAVSNVVSVSAAVVAPGLPTSLSATTTRTDGVNLTFSGSSGATSYDIFWNTSQGAWPSTSATPDFTGVSSPYLDTTISSGVTRYYWVRGRNSAGTSNWYPYQTNGVTGTRLVAVSNATAPTSVGATGGNTTVTVSWSGATNATKYRIWWSTSSTGNGVDPSVSFDAETTLTSYTFTGMSNGTTYYFWVSASNTNSVWTAYSSSPRASATPSAGTSAPATPTGVSVSGSGLVSWTASSGATSYTIQYYLANDATASVSSSGPYSGTSTGTTFQVTYQTGLNWARARVLANNSGGSSAYSAWYPSSTTYV